LGGNVAVEVDDRDRRAGLGERLRAGAPDPSGRTRYEADPVV
jgi:hypothetical protein